MGPYLHNLTTSMTTVTTAKAQQRSSSNPQHACPCCRQHGGPGRRRLHRCSRVALRPSEQVLGSCACIRGPKDLACPSRLFVIQSRQLKESQSRCPDRRTARPPPAPRGPTTRAWDPRWRLQPPLGLIHP